MNKEEFELLKREIFFKITYEDEIVKDFCKEKGISLEELWEEIKNEDVIKEKNKDRIKEYYEQNKEKIKTLNYVRKKFRFFLRTFF